MFSIQVPIESLSYCLTYAVGYGLNVAGINRAAEHKRNMTKKERIARIYARASEMGLSYHETSALIKIERTLHRWAELECGTARGCIERDETTGIPCLVNPNTDFRYPIPDREKGALKRLSALFKSHPKLVPYHQTDPRGCALYVLRAEDIREGESINAVYTRGLAMCV